MSIEQARAALAAAFPKAKATDVVVLRQRHLERPVPKPGREAIMTTMGPDDFEIVPVYRYGFEVRFDDDGEHRRYALLTPSLEAQPAIDALKGQIKVDPFGLNNRMAW